MLKTISGHIWVKHYLYFACAAQRAAGWPRAGRLARLQQHHAHAGGRQRPRGRRHRTHLRHRHDHHLHLRHQHPRRQRRQQQQPHNPRHQHGYNSHPGEHGVGERVVLYSRRLPVQGRELFRWVQWLPVQGREIFSGGSMATCPRTRAFQVGPWLPVQGRELFSGGSSGYLSNDEGF